MPPEIVNALRAYRSQEEQLLSQLIASKEAPSPVAAEVTKGVIGEVAGYAAEELFGLRSVGRKVGRALVGETNKQRLASIMRSIEIQHGWFVESVLSFLTGVSEKTPSLAHPNSNKLKLRISRAQRFARLETRIRNTVVELQRLENADLVSSKDIEDSKRDESTGILGRLPRLSALRALIPEIEPSLRLFIRTALTDFVGLDWHALLKAKFSRDYPRWIAKAQTKGSNDPLDGQTLGELVQTIRSIPELNKLVSKKPEFHLSLTVLSSARSTLMHPLNPREKDVEEEEFQRIVLALRTVTNSLTTGTLVR